MQSIRILFQVSDEEIASNAQRSLFDGLANFDSGLAKSYAFIAVELTDASYARGRYAELAREINKRFPMPVFVLFRTTGGHLTLAFVQRRQHRRNSNRSVLGGVTLIREIDPEKPHRAHLDVLCELALSDRLAWMQRHGKPINFDGLLDALLFTLDTQELNKRFYRELFDWFNWAVSEARFPTGQKRTLPSEEHVIRLITRLLFIWFIKEKGLVDEDLFNETRVKELLKGYERDTGDSYYRAVLQNLFFATLNCEICKREWSSVRRQSHRIFSRYRFHREVQYPDKLFALFRQTPFINGGLFDCLDSVQSNSNSGWRIDCFTDNVTREGTRDYGLVSVPNRLFFEEHVDRRGIFTILNRYKFTVEENTPNEVEVALDPELLGMVFENLLAAYNPETKKTARKQTGSYYTPRQVVEYMVNEALIASLSAKVQPSDGDEEFWQERLRYLFDDADAYEDANELFEDEEAQALIHAIAQIKILDPACGSGAFPMGVLHKLTLALRRIDLENSRWEALQKEKARKRASSAFDAADQQARDSQLREISDTFERYRDSDFGRKLYLIQNSIFGVDIQPVACQIAKLRFFISLAIEQNVDSTKANLGIRPLPNLETRFVAADALLGFKSQKILDSDRSKELESALKSNRERYFHLSTRSNKLAAAEKDVALRQELAEELRRIGLPLGDAERISIWDPYDQNHQADWFDPNYMFGVNGGFDVVLGNPPYVESRSNLLPEEKKRLYGAQVKSDWKGVLPKGSDLLIYFFCRAGKLLNANGNCVMITQNAWLSTNYGLDFQKFANRRFWFHRILDAEEKFFPDVGSQNINTVITCTNRKRTETASYGLLDTSMRITNKKEILLTSGVKWGHLINMPQWFQSALDQVRALETSTGSRRATFGQGLNFPKKKLDDPEGGSVPIIAKGAHFVSTRCETMVDVPLSSTRSDKIPALLMPRGVGSRYYCTLNLGKSFSYSHVEAYLPDDHWLSDFHYCLWAYLNSSFAWLYREITGRKNLGGGLLKCEAFDMKAFPTNVDLDFGTEARQVAKLLSARNPLPVEEELQSKEHLFIDDLVFERLGIKHTATECRKALLEMVAFRTHRART